MQVRIDRPITLHMMGDWGIANLHRICGWIAAELWRRSPPGSKFATWAGRGGSDAIEAVLDGEVHMALFVPAGFARTVVDGKGICRRPDVGRLRALGTLRKTIGWCLRSTLGSGFRVFRSCVRKQPALRLATAPDDGINMTGFAAHRLLEVSGVSPKTIKSWGGKMLLGEGPWDTIPLATRGEADAVLFEAVMTSYWKELCTVRRMNFIPFERCSAKRARTRLRLATRDCSTRSLRGARRSLPGSGFF